MAITRQQAYRLSLEHEKIIDKHARNLERVTGFSVSRADALGAILESFGRVERIREQRIAFPGARIARRTAEKRGRRITSRSRRAGSDHCVRWVRSLQRETGRRWEMSALTRWNAKQ